MTFFPKRSSAIWQHLGMLCLRGRRLLAGVQRRVVRIRVGRLLRSRYPGLRVSVGLWVMSTSAAFISALRTKRS